MTRRLLVLVLLAVGCREVPFGWSPEVDGLVDRLIREKKAELAGPAEQRPVAVFDFDNTTVQGDILYEAVLHVARTGRLGFDVRQPTVFLPTDTVLLLLTDRRTLTDEARARLVRQTAFKLFERYFYFTREADKFVALTFMARVFSGSPPEALKAFVRQAFEGAQARPLCTLTLEPEGLTGEPLEIRAGLRTRPGIRWMMDRLRAAGFDVWVVSASPKPLVEVGAAAYGVPPDHVVGTSVKLDERGRLGTEVVPPIPWRQGKVDAIEAFVKRKPALVFGDSWTDFEMLSVAEHGVLLQTGDAELEEALAAKGTVLLQPRLPSDVPWAPCTVSPLGE